MKLYLLGGESLIRRDARSVNAQAFLDAGGAPNILVFPWARASFDNSYKRRRRITSYFLSLGANAIEFIDYSAALRDIARKVENSDLIYFTGGVPSILVERLRKKGLENLFRHFRGVVVGRRAGALAMCRSFIITERKSKKVTIGEGLGFADFRAKVHYDPSKDEDLKSLSKDCSIVAIPYGSALVQDNDSLFILGNVYLFRSEEKTLLDETRVSCLNKESSKLDSKFSFQFFETKGVE